ncbi:MAG TPA: hypothetical protein VFP32_01075 [Candidatus Saccharimonadales bacterium]|nr:hypothetical protein [Candidatus Saccharimonadales bacterium]
MIKKVKMFLLSISAMLMMVLPLAAGGAALAAAGDPINQTDINNSLCTGSNGSFDTNPSCTNTDASGSVSHLITVVVNVLSIIVGVIAVIMIIIAGLRYVTSGGKEEGVKNAKNTILYAIIGLVIVALAQLIVHYVLNKTTSATNVGGGS